VSILDKAPSDNETREDISGDVKPDRGGRFSPAARRSLWLL